MEKIRCITVDDDPFIRSVLQNLILKDERLEFVSEFEDSVSAAMGITKAKPQILFLDIMLPGLTGLEILDVLDVKPQVIIVSGNKQEDMDLSNQMNVVGYIQKPVTVSKFSEELEKAIVNLMSI